MYSCALTLDADRETVRYAARLLAAERGRVTAATDAGSHTTTTAYTPATGAAATSVAVTDPMGLTTTTAYDPLQDLATTATTPADYVTSGQYDALGRLTAVCEPGLSAAAKVPDLRNTYSVFATAPSVTDTYTLNDDQPYLATENIHDSMLRARETQTELVNGNRDITDTYYNTDGWSDSRHAMLHLRLRPASRPGLERD